jgi:hypothetical protein
MTLDDFKAWYVKNGFDEEYKALEKIYLSIDEPRDSYYSNTSVDRIKAALRLIPDIEDRAFAMLLCNIKL